MRIAAVGVVAIVVLVILIGAESVAEAFASIIVLGSVVVFRMGGRRHRRAARRETARPVAGRLPVVGIRLHARRRGGLDAGTAADRSLAAA